jgi:hypothetical protein
MDNALQAILDNLPPARRRSKLEPYAALIRALRARGRSYREIVTILRERCGLRVAVHTVHHFVHTRARARTSARLRPSRRPASGSAGCSSPSGASLPLSWDEEVWTRIAVVKRRAPASAPEPKTFAFDEHEPLQLIAEVAPRKR